MKNNIHKELKEMTRTALKAFREFENMSLKRAMNEARPSDDRATQISSIFKKKVAL